MFKVTGIAACIFLGLLVLGGCAGPATTAQSSPVPPPAVTSPVNPPAAAPAQSPAPVNVLVANQPLAAPPVTVPVQTSVVGAMFTTTNLKVTPTPVSPGGTVKITTTIKNTGTQAGTYTAVMNMKGDDEACPQISPVSKDVTLAAGQSQDVSFDVLMAAGLAGGYTVTLGSQSAPLIVQ